MKQCLQDLATCLFPKFNSSGPYPHTCFVTVQAHVSVPNFHMYSSHPNPSQTPSLSLLHFIVLYALNKWTSVLLEKPIAPRPVKKFPAFYGTHKFITAFITDRHLSLSWAKSSSRAPILFLEKPFLILLSHLRLGPPSGLFHSDFPAKSRYALIISPIRATFFAHLIFLDFINQIIFGEEYSLWSSFLCNLPHAPVTSSHFGPHIFLGTLFSNTSKLRSSLKVKTLYILIFKFLCSNSEDRKFWTEL
jgi:hypothetical protein